MSWWDIVFKNVKIEEKFKTPGRGLYSLNAKDFKVIYKDSERLVILAGRSCIPLDKKCFDALEDTFKQQPNIKLRVSTVRQKEPEKNSADEIIRYKTGSNLPCANYICAILEKLNLVKYEMDGERKCIVKV